MDGRYSWYLSHKGTFSLSVTIFSKEQVQYQLDLKDFLRMVVTGYTEGGVLRYYDIVFSPVVLDSWDTCIRSVQKEILHRWSINRILKFYDCNIEKIKRSVFRNGDFSGIDLPSEFWYRL